MSRLVHRRPSSILIVDDVAANRELLVANLEDLGYELREARDGVEAMEAVEDQEPDLILLDVEMPRLDGIGVCERLKAHPIHRLIPIVILTAIHSTTPLRFYPDSTDGTYRAGEYLPVQGFVDKPVEPATLVAEVQRVLAAARAP